MIGALVQLIFVIIFLGVAWWAIQTLLPLIPIAEPFATILRVLMVLILVAIVFWVIWQILLATGIVGGSMPTIGLHR